MEMTHNYDEAALDKINRFEPSFDEDGDMDIGSQELFRAMKATSYKTIRHALRVAAKLQEERTERMLVPIEKYNLCLNAYEVQHVFKQILKEVEDVTKPTAREVLQQVTGVKLK
jgi:hypothetical protein